MGMHYKTERLKSSNYIVAIGE